jgi:putative rod shape-determining protein mreC
MAKFHLIPIVLGAAIGVGVYVVSKYLAQDEESEQIVDDSAFDDSEASESTEDADETEENADEEPPAEEPAAEPAPIEEPAPAEQAPVAEPAAPVEEPAQEDDGVTIPIQSGNDVPNVNPVQDKTEPVKLTEDGKVDPTTIAKAEDFGDWEEETGCRG